MVEYLARGRRQLNTVNADLASTNKTLQTTVADLKAAQEQLVQSEKMASLGQLTAGIAHEINNPINFVTANINPLKNDITDILNVIGRYEKLIGEKGLQKDFAGIEQ